MGCDIHDYLEIRREGQWEYAGDDALTDRRLTGKRNSIMPKRSSLEALAMSMMKRAHFPTWDLGTEQLWKAQDPEVRDLWRERANQVINDLDCDGYKIGER